jgi:hypothetical protein
MVTEYYSGSSTTTKTASYMKWNYVSIANDDTSTALTFTVNGITITVLAGEAFQDTFKLFQTITITTTVAYRLVLGNIL